MKIQHISLMLIGAAVLTACNNTPSHKTTPTTSTTVAPQVQPIVFKEPEVSAPFYALNPYDYNKPSEFEVNLYRASVAPVQPLKVSDSAETVLDKNRLLIPVSNSKSSNLHFGVVANMDELDVTEIDDFISLLEGKARHYPTHFTSEREKNGFRNKLKEVIAKLEPIAEKNDASYDVLVRALKVFAMARNMDMGGVYGPKTLTYAKRILSINPHDATANFWLGFSLTEGGGFKEGLPYLQKAMNSGVQEAYLSTVNTYLFMDQRKNALNTLHNYKTKYPTEAQVVDSLSAEIKAGKRYNVWEVTTH